MLNNITGSKTRQQDFLAYEFMVFDIHPMPVQAQNSGFPSSASCSDIYRPARRLGTRTLTATLYAEPQSALALRSPLQWASHQ